MGGYLVAMDAAHAAIDEEYDTCAGGRFAPDVVDVVGVHYADHVPEFVRPAAAVMEPRQVLRFLQNGYIRLHAGSHSFACKNVSFFMIFIVFFPIFHLYNPHDLRLSSFTFHIIQSDTLSNPIVCQIRHLAVCKQTLTQ